jgi:Zn-dependent alcohol dehydrogenase
MLQAPEDGEHRGPVAVLLVLELEAPAESEEGEGAGVVVEAGPGVKDVAEGDRVVLSFIPACGRCEPCARGMSNLCVLGAAIIAGPQLDGTFRFHAKGQGLG